MATNEQPAYTSEGVYTPDDLVLDTSTLQSDSIVLATGQNLSRGTVLGKITASGKYVKSLSDATDGSETPDAVLSEDCDATAADTTTLAYSAGYFNSNALILGASHTLASIKETLRAKNIAFQTASAAR